MSTKAFLQKSLTLYLKIHILFLRRSLRLQREFMYYFARIQVWEIVLDVFFIHLTKSWICNKLATLLSRKGLGCNPARALYLLNSKPTLRKLIQDGFNSRFSEAFHFENVRGLREFLCYLFHVWISASCVHLSYMTYKGVQ